MKGFYNIANLLALQGFYEAILPPNKHVQQQQSNKTHWAVISKIKKVQWVRKENKPPQPCFPLNLKILIVITAN